MALTPGGVMCRQARIGLIALGLIVWLPALQGCTTKIVTRDGQTLPPYAGQLLRNDNQTPVRDVPKPTGFKNVWTGQNGRSGAGSALTTVGGSEYLFQGRAPLQTTTAFYRRELARWQWRPIADNRTPQGWVLRYEKQSRQKHGATGKTTQAPQPAEQPATLEMRFSRQQGVTSVWFLLKR